jgi:DNA invertase Pin-like site-specific DNA recombinase
MATQAQLDNDFALENQSARLHKQAEREGLDVVGEVKVYEKGITLDRPGWREALRLASEKQADAILVNGLGRVARGIEDMAQVLSDMDKLGIKLRTCDGSLPYVPILTRHTL